MSCRVERNADIADLHFLAVLHWFIMSRCVVAITKLDNPDRLRRRQNMVVAASRVVAVTMRDDRLVDGKRGVDIRIDRTYI